VKKIESLEHDMVAALCDLVALPSVSPADGGTGERGKADYLVRKFEELGLGKAEVYEAPDPMSPDGARPNVILRIGGRSPRRAWFVSHIDVVPEGDRSLWSSDPFIPVVKDGRVYGRGANDNCEEVTASLFAAFALKELGLTPAYEVGLCFVADEEFGSAHGICHLLDAGLFSPDDLVYVPDSGSEAGDFIEIAEKSIVWMQFEVEGKQVHASIPDDGNNACRAANEFSCELDKALRRAFPETNSLFKPPRSTFEPTRRDQNVANVNTLPGREVFCFDCRVLPEIPISRVESTVNDVVRRAEEKYGIVMRWKYLQNNQAPPPTSPDAPAVAQLKRAISQVLRLEPVVGGIGGGTCAAFFRHRGIPAVVWGQANHTAHMPDENVDIAHMLNEAKVFALVMMGV
jgi:succinyl-diaminopimelate desuccinylase